MLEFLKKACLENWDKLIQMANIYLKLKQINKDLDFIWAPYQLAGQYSLSLV